MEFSCVWSDFAYISVLHFESPDLIPYFQAQYIYVSFLCHNKHYTRHQQGRPCLDKFPVTYELQLCIQSAARVTWR